MNIRRLLLRFMLVSLAVAAVVGAGSVLILPAGDVWRIFGTGILTAFGCAALLPISLLTDKPKSRPEGLLGMAIILIEYLLGLCLIWGSAGDLGDSAMEQFGFAALFLPAVGVPAVALLRTAGTQIGRWAGRVGVALAGVEFVLLMIAVRVDALNSNEVRAMGTAAACAIFFPLLIMSLAGLGVAPGRLWRWPAIAAACVSLALALVGVWRKSDGHAGAYALLVSIPMVLAYLNVAMLCPLKPGQIWARWVAVLSVSVTAICVDCGVFLNAGGDGEIFGRLSAATGIIAGCSTLALLILAALNRKIERSPVSLENVRGVDVICPLCKKRQTVAIGGAACVECGLQIDIKLEQPVCGKCGYLLYHMKSGRCPECGTEVSEAAVAAIPA